MSSNDKSHIQKEKIVQRTINIETNAHICTYTYVCICKLKYLFYLPHSIHTTAQPVTGEHSTHWLPFKPPKTLQIRACIAHDACGKFKNVVLTKPSGHTGCN